MKLYGDDRSGNCYKVRLLLNQLERDYEWIPVDVTNSERPPEFRAENPFGRAPYLILDDGTGLPESNAILFHLADGTPYLPTDSVARTRVLQWMFFEQNAHEPNIAVTRYAVVFAGNPPDRQAELEVRRSRGREVLATMDQHLSSRSFFVDDTYTIADIALFAYTHNAGEAGLDIRGLAHVQAWLARVRAQPRFVEQGGWV